MTRFTAGDIDRANWDWQCSCGPAAMAAVCELTLDEVKQLFMPAFPGWTTPTRMFNALQRHGATWSWRAPLRNSRAILPWPIYGMARIRWEGPWTMPGANPRWAYTHTHWVGVSQGAGSRGQRLVDVFDVNTVGDGSPLQDGWGPLEWWASEIAPLLTADIKRATGGWHVTHSIEIERPKKQEG